MEEVSEDDWISRMMEVNEPCLPHTENPRKSALAGIFRMGEGC